MLTIMSASMVNTPIIKRIRENLDKDPIVSTILKLIEEGKTCQFWVEDGLLWANGGSIFVQRVGDL